MKEKSFSKKKVSLDGGFELEICTICVNIYIYIYIYIYIIISLAIFKKLIASNPSNLNSIYIYIYKT